MGDAVGKTDVYAKQRARLVSSPYQQPLLPQKPQGPRHMNKPRHDSRYTSPVLFVFSALCSSSLIPAAFLLPTDGHAFAFTCPALTSPLHSGSYWAALPRRSGCSNQQGKATPSSPTLASTPAWPLPSRPFSLFSVFGQWDHHPPCAEDRNVEHLTSSFQDMKSDLP